MPARSPASTRATCACACAWRATACWKAAGDGRRAGRHHPRQAVRPAADPAEPRPRVFLRAHRGRRRIRQHDLAAVEGPALGCRARPRAPVRARSPPTAWWAARAARSSAAATAGRRLAENVAEFLLEERRVLVRPSRVEAFADDVEPPARRRRARRQAHRQARTETGQQLAQHAVVPVTPDPNTRIADDPEIPAPAEDPDRGRSATASTKSRCPACTCRAPPADQYRVLLAPHHVAARDPPAPGAGRAGPDLREVRPGAVDPSRPDAAGYRGRAVAAAGPRAAVRFRPGHRPDHALAGRAARTSCSPASSARRWPRPRSPRSTSPR